MILSHRRRYLVDLEIKEANSYGFDTFQVAQIHSGSNLSVVTNDVAELDKHFVWEEEDEPTRKYDLLLSIKFWGDPNACPRHKTAKEAAGKVGVVDREGWYNNAGHAFYTGLKNRIQQMVDEYGDRVVGVRWNHEIPPYLFKTGDVWDRHARNCHSEDYNWTFANSAF